jgi:hypothetical protein
MFGEKMQIKKAPQALKYLWDRKFFDDKERKFIEIKKEIGKLHCNPSDATLHMALRAARYLTRRGQRGDYSYIQKYASKGMTLDEDLFPERLVQSLGKDFVTEISDLNLNFGKSGTCTAFLLRKTLEKLIFLAFAKNNLANQLRNAQGDFVGLKAMLNLATTNKIQGKPFLMPKTAKEIEGIKFLGDTSAHNPLTNVEMKTIIPQMPFIITAYEELSKRL